MWCSSLLHRNPRVWLVATKYSRRAAQDIWKVWLWELFHKELWSISSSDLYITKKARDPRFWRQQSWTASWVGQIRLIEVQLGIYFGNCASRIRNTVKPGGDTPQPDAVCILAIHISALMHGIQCILPAVTPRYDESQHLSAATGPLEKPQNKWLMRDCHIRGHLVVFMHPTLMLLCWLLSHVAVLVFL